MALGESAAVATPSQRDASGLYSYAGEKSGSQHAASNNLRTSILFLSNLRTVASLTYQRIE